MIVEDAAASGDALGAARRAMRVARRRMSVVARVVPVGDPFPHVAGHVQQAVRACSARKRVDGRGVGVAVVVLRITPRQVAAAIAVVEPSGIELLPPRIYALIGPAGGLLPFRLGGQTGFAPLAERHGVGVRHTDDGVGGERLVAEVVLPGLRACPLGAGQAPVATHAPYWAVET